MTQYMEIDVRINISTLTNGISRTSLDLQIVHIYIFICGSRTLVNLGRFFLQFLYLYTVGRTPWTGDQPVVRPQLYTE
jgi:hypothetical protein